MGAKEKILARLDELVKEGEAVLRTEQTNEWGYYVVDSVPAKEWEGKVASVVRMAFGADSIHTRQIEANIEKGSLVPHAKTIFSALKAARSDWAGDFVGDVRKLAEADVCADLLGQASHLEDNKYHLAAVVIAGAVLEQHIRSMCDSRSIATNTDKGASKNLELMNQELTKANAYDMVRAHQIRTWSALRNDAAHGQPFDEKHVPDYLRGITDFCATVK